MSPAQKFEKVDSRLFELANRQSLLEYKQAVGQSVDEEELLEIGRERTALLADALIVSEALPKKCNSGLGRRMVLFKAQRQSEQLENAPQIVATRAKLEKLFGNFDYMGCITELLNNPESAARRAAIEKIAQFGQLMEPFARNLFDACNREAKAIGFSGYIEAKLAPVGLKFDRLRGLFASWRDDNLGALQEIFRQNEGKIKVPEDLLYVFRSKNAAKKDCLEKNKLVACVGTLLDRLGLTLDELPIKIEFGKLSNCGACFRIQPGKNVRVILRHDLDPMSAYFFLLHEIGHALYYCFCPTGSEMLIDSHVTREILADVFTHFLFQEWFLCDVAGMPIDQAEEFILAKKEQQALELLIYLRDSMFTFELLKDPHRPFVDVWFDVTKKWLGIEDYSGAFETFDFSNPLDMKDYVLSQVFSKKVFDRYFKSTDGSSCKEGMSEFMQRFYVRGNDVDWQEKIGVIC